MNGFPRLGVDALPSDNHPPPWKDLVGPWLYGILASVFLVGIIYAQAFEYYRSYRDDRWPMKCLVMVLNFGDTFHSTLSPSSYLVAQFFTPLSTALSQAFFAHRTIALTKSDWLAGGLGVLILVNLGVGLALSVVYYNYFQSLEPSALSILLTMIQAASWVSAFTDFTISSIFIYYMNAMKKPFKDYEMPSNSVAGRLLMMSFQTAALTSLFAIGNAVTTKVVGSRGQWAIIWSLTLPNIFVISVMYVLNARRQLREGHSTHDSSNSRAAHNRKTFAQGASQAGQIQVTLQTFTHTDSPVGEEVPDKWEDDSTSTTKDHRVVKFNNEAI